MEYYLGTRHIILKAISLILDFDPKGSSLFLFIRVISCVITLR
jgi:hypothetical protein